MGRARAGERGVRAKAEGDRHDFEAWGGGFPSGAQDEHLSGWLPWSCLRGGLQGAPGVGAGARSAYLHVVVHAVVRDSQQGAVVAPQSFPASGDLELLQLLQLGHGPLPLAGSPGSLLVLCLTPLLIGRSACPPPTAFGFLSVRDPNLLAKSRQAHSGTRGSQSPLPGPAPLCPLPGGRGKPGAPLGAQPPNPSQQRKPRSGRCDCSLGLQRKLFGGGGGWGGRLRRKGAGLLWVGGGGGFSTHGRGGRTEGGGFLGKLRDESPRARGVDGGWDMETSHAGGYRVVQPRWKPANAAARGISPDTRKTHPEAPEQGEPASEGLCMKGPWCTWSVPHGGKPSCGLRDSD